MLPCLHAFVSYVHDLTIIVVERLYTNRIALHCFALLCQVFPTLQGFCLQKRDLFFLAEAQNEFVWKLLYRPVRDQLPQISTQSQMRDRCSRLPLDTGRWVRLLITIMWVMKILFIFGWLWSSPDRITVYVTEFKKAMYTTCYNMYFIFYVKIMFVFCEKEVSALSTSIEHVINLNCINSTYTKRLWA